MLIEKVSIKAYQLPLKTVWKDSHFSMASRKGWIISLYSEGLTGQGDCAPLPSAGTETWQQAQDWLSQNLQQLSGKTSDEIELLVATCPGAIACGLDTALIDLLSQEKKLSISQWLNPECENQINTNINWGALIDIDPCQINQQSVAPVIKLKLGPGDIRREIKLLHAICDQLPADSKLRVDANQAWSLDDARFFIESCSNLPLESIEEPLASPSLKNLKKLQADSPFPIALDESIQHFKMQDLFADNIIKRLTLKPMVVGGLTKTLQLAARAQAVGMQSVITTTVDSAIGVWAAVHVTAALGQAGRNLAHGLATSHWLERDVSRAPLICNNKITLNQTWSYEK